MKVTYIIRTWPRKDSRCCAEIGDALKPYRDRGGYQLEPGDYGCTRLATWMIDGKPYCTLHGGALAVKYLAENQK